MAWRIELTATAAKQLGKLDKHEAKRITRFLRERLASADRIHARANDESQDDDAQPVAKDEMQLVQQPMHEAGELDDDEGQSNGVGEFTDRVVGMIIGHAAQV